MTNHIADAGKKPLDNEPTPLADESLERRMRAAERLLRTLCEPGDTCRFYITVDKEKKMNEPVLCYVDEPWAYFTTQKLEDQWGDDWNDAPYEHNAGPPYEYREHDKADGKEPWQIIKVAYDGMFDTPAWSSNSMYSVEMINSKAVAWLLNLQSEKTISILAGTKLSEFCRLIREGGGDVYIKEER